MNRSNIKNISKHNKQKSLILIRILVFLIPTFAVLFIIGTHSHYLIKKSISMILGILLVISILILVYSIIKYFRNKNTGRIRFKKGLRFIINTFLIIYILGCVSLLVLLYGPNHKFKDWLITTAMGTMHHQYYCQIFYSDQEIEEVMSRNYIIEPEGDTDASLVSNQIDLSKLNEYERKIYEDYKPGDKYKIIRFKVNGQDAFLAAVYDPASVSVATTKYLFKSGQFVVDMAKDNQAPLAINGGGFIDPNYSSNGSTPHGITISNSKVITDYNIGSWGVIGINKDNVLVLSKNKKAQQLVNEGVRDAVTRGPFLIVNGKSAFTAGSGGWGYAARTAIGQRADGVILLLVVNSNATRTNGASMVDLTNIMENYGAINASALDGGTSSVMVENYEVINDPINASLAHKTRPIATSWRVK